MLRKIQIYHYKQVSSRPRTKLIYLLFRKYSFKFKGPILNSMDSDSEDEPLKRPVTNGQKPYDLQSREQQREEPDKVSSGIC